MEASRIACSLASAVLLQGCFLLPDKHDSPDLSTTTTSTTTLEPATNLWQWRSDADFYDQILIAAGSSVNLYGGCWAANYLNESGLLGTENLAASDEVVHGPLAEQFIDASSSKTYGTYDGDSGVTLFNKRNSSDMGGCLMRKSRVPVDLSSIDRMELDITANGTSDEAPWYSVWLVPMLYSGPNGDDTSKSAEIDLIENYDYERRGMEMNRAVTTFAECGQPGFDWSFGVCTAMDWNEPAGHIFAHITLKAVDDDGRRSLRVYRCEQGSSTCGEDSPYAEIRVDADPPTDDIERDQWFPIWNQELAGAVYGHYWLVADIWWTSDSDFQLKVDNVKFFKSDTEWKMPLDGQSPSAPTTTGAPEPSPAPSPEPSPEPTPGPEPSPSPSPAGNDGDCCGEAPLECCSSQEGCCPADASLWCCSAGDGIMV